MTYTTQPIIPPYVSENIKNGYLYTWKGKNYYENGTVLQQNKVTNIKFPYRTILDPTNELRIEIFNPVNHKPLFTDKDFFKFLNSKTNSLIRSAIKKIPSYFGTSSDLPNLFLFEYFKNKSVITVANQKKIRNRDNNITHRFDARWHFKLSSNDKGKKPIGWDNIQFKPTTYFDTYESKNVDFYGAAFYGGKWYGIRMVSTDFER
jgi:hypothetical protein